MKHNRKNCVKATHPCNAHCSFVNSIVSSADNSRATADNNSRAPADDNSRAPAADNLHAHPPEEGDGAPGVHEAAAP